VLVVAAIAASCGGGGESSDTTERTRNAAFWVPNTEPNKVIVYGRQDGLVASVPVDGSSSPVAREITQLTIGSSWNHNITGVAIDSAQSELIYSGVNKTNEAFLAKYSLDGSSETSVFTMPDSWALAMGYDPSTRLVAMTHVESGTPMYVLHSVDEINSPIVSMKSGSFSGLVFDGTKLYSASGEVVYELNPADIESFSKVSTSVGTPRDLYSLAKDSLTSNFYGARHDSNQLLTIDLFGSSGNSKFDTSTSPVGLAVFTDGTLAVSKGGNPMSHTSAVGALTIYDPTGVTAPYAIKTVTTGATLTGLQSIWAVESPIAAKRPAIDGTLEVGGTMTCSDATWREDLPLSRLSRAPISSVRSYQWFLNGAPIMGATSESYVPTIDGAYTCAVEAANYAGSGRSEFSDVAKVVEAPATTTLAPTTTVASGGPTTTTASGGSEPVTTSPSSGGAEAVPGVSPVVTVPEVATGTPVAVVTPTLRSAKWTFKGRTAKITFKKWSGASKYRFYVRGATRKNIVCKTAKTTVTCSTTSLKKGLNTFSAKALSRSGITLALSTKTRNTK